MFKTKVCEEGGTKAIWNEEFSLDKVGFKLENILQFYVFDVELIGTRDLGHTSAVLQIKDFVNNYTKDFKPK